ncbi:MAG: hypothetical protein CMH57_04900 [Myxococcales bacterium]|nr:hypothetical protein [Myxococcales bacterium]
MSDNRTEDQLLTSIKARQGRVTLGDAVVDTGLPRAEVEAQLRRLLSLYKSHLEVDENGELVYHFDPSLTRRGDDGRWLYELGLKAWGLFKAGFKVTIMVVLVVYFLLFVALIIAALVASASGGRSSSDSSPSSGRRGFPGGGMLWWFWGSPSYRRGYRGSSSRGFFSSARRDEEGAPFYSKVFAYVFGPEVDEDAREDEKRLLAFIRANKGVITVADVMAHAGLGRVQAEEEVARILVQYEGDTHVTSEGVILYTFNQLAVSAGGRRSKRESPSWERLHEPRALTGNSSGVNALITFLNGFNILGALLAPGFIMAQLGIAATPLTLFGLAVFPMIFSLIFFAIPAIRWMLLKREQAAQARENARRLVLGEVLGGARRGRSLSAAEVVREVSRKWPASAAGEADSAMIRERFQELAREVEGVDVGEGGGALQYSFPSLALELEEVKRYRALIDPAELRLGRIVFSSADEDTGLDDFDEQLSPTPRAPMSERQLQREAPALGDFDAALSGSRPPAARDDEAQAALDDFERRLRGDEGASAEDAEVEVEEVAQKRDRRS